MPKNLAASRQNCKPQWALYAEPGANTPENNILYYPRKPLVPPEVDLRGWPRMQINRFWLREQRRVLTPSQFGHFIALIDASWDEIPAGSLPSDRRALARLCGISINLRYFYNNLPIILSGFLFCSDERMYHPSNSETVLKAWKVKVSSEAMRAAKARKAASGTERCYRPLRERESRKKESAGYASPLKAATPASNGEAGKPFHVRYDTPQWDAWRAYELANGQKAPNPAGNGRYFASEWPPGEA